MSIEVGQTISGEVVKSIATAQTSEDAECVVVMFESGGGIIMGVDVGTGKFRDAIRLSPNALDVVAQVVINARKEALSSSLITVDDPWHYNTGSQPCGDGMTKFEVVLYCGTRVITRGLDWRLNLPFGKSVRLWRVLG